jgi:hypothetical protein
MRTWQRMAKRAFRTKVCIYFLQAALPTRAEQAGNFGTSICQEKAVRKSLHTCVLLIDHRTSGRTSNHAAECAQASDTFTVKSEYACTAA